MSDFFLSWQISRQRFDDVVLALNAEQLNFRLQPGALTIGEMALHVAGVEVSFISQLLGLDLDAFDGSLKAAATDGVVNDLPFPFAAEEITPALVSNALSIARSMAEPVLSNPSDLLRQKQIKSALGPIIDGNGALARLAFHPGYHQGQAYLIAESPVFPRL